MALANLIIKIGTDLAELKTGSDKAIATMEKTAGKIDNIGSVIQKTLLGAFSVGAIVSFGKSVFDAASDIDDMSKRMGVSAEAVQGFKFAAEQAGTTLDAFGTAINKMNLKLAGGDKSTVKALADLGLGFNAVRSMRPEDAFLTITDAIAKIPNQADKVRIGTELMGKGFAEILPAIESDIRGTSRAIEKWSNETTKRLADAEDAWGKLGTKVTIVSGEILANLMAGRKFTAQYQQDQMRFGTAYANQMADVAAREAEHAGKRYDAYRKVAPAIHKTAEELAAETAAMKKASDALEAHAKAIQGIRDKYSGADLAKKVRDLGEAMRGLGADANWNELAEDAGKLFQQGAKLTPELMRLTIAFGQLSPKLDQSALDVQKLGQHFEVLTPQIDKVWEALNKPIPFGIAHLKDELGALVAITPETMLKGALGADLPKKTFEAIFGTSKDFGARMGATIMGAIQGGGDIFKAIGGSIGMDVGTHFGDKLGKFFSKEGAGTFSKALGGMFSSVLPGIGALMGPLLGKIGGAIANVFNRNKGRDIVEEFAAGFGGFESLHKQLGELGARGEQLWIKLTQGVGRNNPDQAKAAIEAITAALDKQKGSTDLLTSAMQEYGFTWEDLPAEKRSAELASMFDTLFEKTQVLKDAGIDYHEILLRQATGYSELVQSAIRSGTEIPSAMQPVLQDLVDLGLLVDDSGQSFSDLGQVSWAKTLTQGFDQVTKAIYDLTDALTKGVGGALDELGRRTVKIPIKFDVDDTPGGGGKPPGFATGTRGQFMNFGTGTLAMLHGRERVVTEQENLGVDGGDIVVTLDAGELWDQRVVRVARKDASRGGLRPRSGHGRSW